MSKSNRASKKVFARKTNAVYKYVCEQLYNSPLDEWPAVLQIKHLSLEHCKAVDQVSQRIKSVLKC